MESSGEVAAARAAATVMLLRDAEGGLEVFLQRRVKAMAFAPSVTVFPGGGVDRRDQELDPARWAGPDPSWWAERFGCPPELAAALVCAAVRETFEECGVLLAGTRDGAALVPDAAELAAARAELLQRRGSLAETLDSHDWVLRADLLRPWSNWITPEVEPRRYDARFFAAALPAGQHADAGTTEVTEAGWYRPVDALAAWKAGEIELLPPTWVTLEQLAEAADTAAVLAAGERRAITPLLPQLRGERDELQLVLPDELGFGSTPMRLRTRPTGPGPVPR
jgi:8-oxo-dGTP pyrophosphatase MutT (NUDIX family)